MSETTSIKLRDGLKDRVRSIAEREQRSSNHIMNEAISDYVDRKERRAVYRAEMEASHREYRETGLHLTHEEVVEWMNQRKADPKAPMPKLHK